MNSIVSVLVQLFEEYARVPEPVPKDYPVGYRMLVRLRSTPLEEVGLMAELHIKSDVSVLEMQHTHYIMRTAVLRIYHPATSDNPHLVFHVLEPGSESRQPSAFNMNRAEARVFSDGRLQHLWDPVCQSIFDRSEALVRRFALERAKG